MKPHIRNLLLRAAVSLRNIVAASGDDVLVPRNVADDVVSLFISLFGEYARDKETLKMTMLRDAITQLHRDMIDASGAAEYIESELNKRLEQERVDDSQKNEHIEEVIDDLRAQNKALTEQIRALKTKKPRGH